MDLHALKQRALSSQERLELAFSVFWLVLSGMTGLGRRRDWVQLWCFVEKGSLAFATDRKMEPGSPAHLWCTFAARYCLHAVPSKGGGGLLYSLRMSVCTSEAVSTFSTSSHLQFLFPRKKGVRPLHFIKLTEVLSTDAAQEMFFFLKKKKRKDAL